MVTVVRTADRVANGVKSIPVKTPFLKGLQGIVLALVGRTRFVFVPVPRRIVDPDPDRGVPKCRPGSVVTMTNAESLY